MVILSSIVYNMGKLDVFQKTINNRLNALLHIHKMEHSVDIEQNEVCIVVERNIVN